MSNINIIMFSNINATITQISLTMCIHSNGKSKGRTGVKISEIPERTDWQQEVGAADSRAG